MLESFGFEIKLDSVLDKIKFSLLKSNEYRHLDGSRSFEINTVSRDVEINIVE